MNTPVTSEQLERVKNALFQGNKIEAIKLYREGTGIGLAESKQAIEAFEEELRKIHPDRFARPSGVKGCAGLIVVGIFGLGSMAWGVLYLI